MRKLASLRKLLELIANVSLTSTDTKAAEELQLLKAAANAIEDAGRMLPGTRKNPEDAGAKAPSDSTKPAQPEVPFEEPHDELDEPQEKKRGRKKAETETEAKEVPKGKRAKK
jgi:hypothetical protein